MDGLIAQWAASTQQEEAVKYHFIIIGRYSLNNTCRRIQNCGIDGENSRLPGIFRSGI